MAVFVAGCQATAGRLSSCHGRDRAGGKADDASILVLAQYIAGPMKNHRKICLFLANCPLSRIFRPSLTASCQWPTDRRTPVRVFPGRRASEGEPQTSKAAIAEAPRWASARDVVFAGKCSGSVEGKEDGQFALGKARHAVTGNSVSRDGWLNDVAYARLTDNQSFLP